MKSEAEIQERNKDIALMLGWIDNDGDLIVPKHLSIGYDYGEWATTKKIQNDEVYKGFCDTHYINVTDTGFSTNWNWLMEAVEFIEKQKMEVSIIEAECAIIDTEKALLEENPFMVEPICKCFDGETKKESTFIAVSDFAKLYNKKKT